MSLSIIVAVAENGVIGRDGQIPWHVSTDLKRFRKLTTGNTVIMGRRTFESIGRPLSDRQNIVVTSNPDLHPDVDTTSNLTAALDQARHEHVFVIGGARLYEAALPIANTAHITRILHAIEGDTFFPLERVVAAADWQLAAVEEPVPSPRDNVPFRFEQYERILTDA